MTVPSHRDAESNRALLRAIAATNRFDLKALPDNRAGALSSAQARAIGRRDRTYRRVRLGLGTSVLAGFFVLILAPTLMTRAPSLEDLSVVAVILAIGGVLIWQGRRGTGTRDDLADGKMARVEGLGHREQRSTTGRSSAVYAYEIGDERFEVTEAAYQAFVEGVRYRAYFLPRSRLLLNVEPLDDEETADGGENEPRDVER